MHAHELLHELDDAFQDLDGALSDERAAVMRFDHAAIEASSGKKSAVGERLEALLGVLAALGNQEALGSQEDAQLAAARAQAKQRLSGLRRRLHENHALLGFTQRTLRGVLAHLSRATPPAVYDPRGALRSEQSALVRRVL